MDHADGEFLRAAFGEPYSISGPETKTQQILYTTKPVAVTHILRRHDLATHVTTIGRYGLPCDRDVAELLSVACGRSFAFLGDADPVDLLIFAWLRSRLPIKYLGINDSLVETLGFEFDDRTMIRLSNSESSSMPLLALTCPDFRDLLGPRCAQLLESGGKLEIESIASFSSGDGNAFARFFAL